MTEDNSKTISRLLAAGVPRTKAADDTATLMKLFKVPEEQADPLPTVKQAKITPVRYEPPQVMRLETPRNDYAEEFLMKIAAAKAKARAKATGG